MSNEITKPGATGDNWPDPSLNIKTEQGGSTSSKVDIDQSTGKNDWGPWVAVACLLGGLAFGGVLVGSIFVPELIESRAKAESSMAQAQATIARQDVKIQQARLDALVVELHKRGIDVVVDHH